MKNSGGQRKKVYKLKKRKTLIFSLLMLSTFLISIGGLLGAKSIITDMIKYFAAGDVPANLKDRVSNNNGTYNISLEVTGEAEKQPNKANVIVIVDRSGSMRDDTGTDGYTPVSYDGNNLYGLVDGEYVRLYRLAGNYTEFTGTPSSSGTYYGWFNKQFLRVYYNNGTYYRTREGSSMWGYTYSDPYDGTVYTRTNQNTNYYYTPDGSRYNGQRYSRQQSGQSRLGATQEAVNNLAETLLSYNGRDGNPTDTIEMALVSFAGTASTNVSKTNDYDTFETAVNRLSADGGTNWEAALRQANGINFNDSDPTYVIFFTDGAPTIRNNGTGTTGTGQEEEPNMSNCYNAATDDATTLANKYGADKFYTIFAYGESYGSSYLSQLTSAAGAPSSNNYSAENTADLQAAFAEILGKIEMAGIGNVKMDDGTPNDISIESASGQVQVVDLLEVDTSSFKYWKKTSESEEFVEWTSADDPAPPAAEFDGSHVTWDLSNLGVLENGVTYKVTFDVYPSQYTYDLVADLKNGTKNYSDLPSEIKQYLHADYTLETNTSATLSYDDTRDSAGIQSVPFTEDLGPVATDSSTISIKKIWNNLLDGRMDKPITVNLQRDKVNFYPVELNSDNQWEKDDIFIAVGLAKLSDSGELKVLDVGHDYKFAELGYEAFNWNLETETVHPMLINGVRTKLILVDSAPSGMGAATYYVDPSTGDKYYKLANGNVYVDAGTEPNIQATNHRRSNLNVKKLVDGEAANPEDEFLLEIKN